MPKDSRRKRLDCSHDRRSHSYHRHDRSHSDRKKHSSKSSTGVKISNNHYRLVIKNCENMLSDIRLQIDQLCEEFQHKNTQPASRLVSSSSSSTTRNSPDYRSLNSISRHVSIMNRSSFESNNSHGLPRLPALGNNTFISSQVTPQRFQSVDKMVEYLKSNCALKSSITRNAIDNVMSISSTCQLQLLEVSLQCPLSKSKINIPIKTKTCQHLGCFDAKTFLSVMMMKKQPKCWKCPICSACAELDWLIVDGFIQDIINATPNDAMKVEFTSSSNWRLKKDTEPSVLSSKVQSHTGTVECIDLTYSPLPKKSVVIDLTHSP